MKVVFTFLLIIGLISCQAVISRNGKVQEMIDALKENEKLYDDVIGILEEKMKKDYDSCINSVKSLSCSDSQIWEQQRSKSSKNITNLKEKIRKHNRTIDALLQLNKQEVTKKNLTMVKLFPQIEKIKNDIELIENMLFLIEDTYLNLDTAGKSLLLLFDHEFDHPKAQQMQQSFIQLMSKHKSLFKADPPTKPAEGDKPAAEAKPAAEGDKPAAEGDKPAAEGEPAEDEKKEGDKVPLIDEDIFDGEADKTELEVGNLFQPSEEEQAAEITADEIPDGVDVQEHDQDRWGNTIEPLEDTNTEDLRIYEVREDFKKSIKEMGKIMHEQLKIVHDGLDSELDMRVQAVADLEKAIIDLHHKHAKQLVQIYIESKKLQQTIFELDDQVLSLDAQIFDCQNSDKRLEKCETRKGLDQVVLDDLKTEKSFNAGSLKELEKLKEFDDKNVYEPGPMEPDAAAIAAEEAQNAEAAKQAEVETKIQQRIHSIKDEEQEVQQELQDEEEKEQQLAEKHPELRGSVLPEHLAEVPEVMQSAVEQIPEAAQKLIQAKEQLIEKEEDSVLEQVDQELKGQDEDNNLVFLKKNKSI